MCGVQWFLSRQFTRAGLWVTNDKLDSYSMSGFNNYQADNLQCQACSEHDTNMNEISEAVIKGVRAACRNTSKFSICTAGNVSKCMQISKFPAKAYNNLGSAICTSQGI